MARRGDRRRARGPGGNTHGVGCLAALGVRGRLHRGGGAHRDGGGADGLTHVELDGGGSVTSTDAGSGQWQCRSTRGRSPSSRRGRRRTGRLATTCWLRSSRSPPWATGFASATPAAARGRDHARLGRSAAPPAGCHRHRELEGRGHSPGRQLSGHSQLSAPLSTSARSHWRKCPAPGTTKAPARFANAASMRSGSHAGSRGPRGRTGSALGWIGLQHARRLGALRGPPTYS